MATMKFKRSAVPSKVPTTFDLALGEFALNTFDGKLYVRGENSSGAFVTEIGTGGGGGGGGTWGSITGTLSAQTDLQSALNAKVSVSDLSEAIDDRVSSLLVEGAGVVLTYDDIANTLTVSLESGPLPNWVKVAEIDITTPVASVDVLGLSAYQDLRVVLEDVTASATGQRTIRFSSDNGASWSTDFNDFGFLSGSAAFNFTTASNTTGFYPTAATTGAAQNMVSELQNFGLAARTFMMSANRSQVYVHFPKVAQNAIQIVNTSGGAVAGNITGGKLLVYGLPKAIEVGTPATWGTIVGALLDQTDLAAALAKNRYSVPFGFTTTPIVDEVLLIHVFAQPVTFAGNWVGARSSVGTNPASSWVLTLAKNGATVGTITVSAAGAVTFASTSGAPVSFAAGDVLRVTGPSPAGSGITNSAFTLLGDFD